jgi:putative transposase
MARPLRIEYEGAVHHVMSRGNARASIVADDEDRKAWVAVLGHVAERFQWRVWAYCLMDNHFHVLVETPNANLSRGMRELNGVYTQAFNRRHGRVGHLLQGRFKALVVEKDAYLLELNRYVVLNPVRAGMVEQAGDWPWSSYRAVMGKAKTFDALEDAALLSLFGSETGPARRAYGRFVAQGLGADDPAEHVTNQVFLGSEAFVGTVTAKVGKASSEVPKRQRQWKNLKSIERAAKTRDEAIRDAYATVQFTLRQIGEHFELHYATVSRIARS